MWHDRHLGPYGAHQVWLTLNSGPTGLTEFDIFFLLFLCSLLRLCCSFLCRLLLSNSPSPTFSRLEQVILTTGNGLPLRPVLVLPTWPGMPHWVTHGVAMLSNEFIPVMTQGPMGKRQVIDWVKRRGQPPRAVNDRLKILWWGAFFYRFVGVSKVSH